MSFIPKAFNKNMLPTKYDVICAILFIKNQKTNIKIKDFTFIKIISLEIIEIWSRASLGYETIHAIRYKIKLIFNKYLLFNKNKMRLPKLSKDYNVLFDIAKREDNLCIEDRQFLDDQRKERIYMIGNITWSEGGLYIFYIISI